MTSKENNDNCETDLTSETQGLSKCGLRGSTTGTEDRRHKQGEVLGRA